MFKYLVPAAVLSLMTATSASAMTSGSALPQLKPMTSELVQTVADYPRHRGNFRDDRRDRRNYRYVPGRRYSHAPAHWRRYHSRPREWRTWGCVLVGPVWFCP